MPRKTSSLEAHAYQLFRIGALARMTGVPTVTIRMWERRHQALQPQRTSKNGRLYDERQVRRLALLRDLTAAGHAISTIAGLDDAALAERLQTAHAPAPARAAPARVVLVGERWSGASPPDVVRQVEVVWTFPSLAAAQAAEGLVADALVVDLDVIEPVMVEEIERLRLRCAARGALVVYQFAERRILGQLERGGVLALHGPFGIAQLGALLPALLRLPPATPPAAAPTGAAPPRRFSPAQLRDAAARSQVLRCECPEHLTDLIGRLVAFETYSRQCELGHPGDARVHQDLHVTTAQARRLLEEALARLMEHEAQRSR